MDCSSFASWLYWIHFGAGTDHLSAQGWQGGTTDSMSTRGRYVTHIGTSPTIQPGDLCFHGASSSITADNKGYGHVVVFVGSGKVVGMGCSGLTTASVTSLSSRDYDTIHCRSYDAFFA